MEHHRLVGLSTEILEPSVKLSISCRPLLKKPHTVKQGGAIVLCYKHNLFYSLASPKQ